MAALQDFFYDGQIERFLAQFIRILSGFQVEYGKDAAGATTLQRIPVYYGDGSRQVASIINNASENTLPPVPAMTVYINGIKYDRERVQDPSFVGKMHIRQREFDDQTQEYTQRQGNAFTIERQMPVPYELDIKVDVWTSNTKQKLQVFEQLAILFNPALEIQSTDNYIDWSSLSVVFLETQNWSSRSVPIGTDNPVDILTLTFKLPIWISPPAKVKKLGVIHKIISNIHESNGDLSASVFNEANLMGTRQYFTPLDYGVLLVDNTLTLLKAHEFEDPRDPTLETQTKVGSKDLWRSLINVYGEITNGISQIRLNSENHEYEIVGTISYHPDDDTLLIFNADTDTYPTNTLQTINAIIDPKKDSAADLALGATTGTRYLILNDIGSFNNPPSGGAIAWNGTDGSDLVAKANDIIEYDGVKWNVSFDSQSTDTLQFVSNLNTGTQYKWDEGKWVMSWAGEYKNGFWTLVL